MDGLLLCRIALRVPRTALLLCRRHETLCTTPMERFIRLAAVLAACLPARALVAPYLAAPTPTAGTGPLALERRTITSTVSRNRSSRPLVSSELRATGNACWSEDDISAAREALINSEGFQALVKRMEGESHVRDEIMAENIMAAVPAERASSLSPDDVGGRDPYTLPTNIAATAATQTAEEDKKKRSWARSSRSTWRKNEEKLKSLRTTVLESDTAREIAGSLRAGNGSLRNTRTAVAAANNISAAAVVAETCPAGSGVKDGVHQVGKSGFDSVAGRRDVEDAFVPEKALRGGRAGPPAVRWIRKVASKVSSKVSNVGKRARGRVARAVGHRRQDSQMS